MTQRFHATVMSETFPSGISWEWKAKHLHAALDDLSKWIWDEFVPPQTVHAVLRRTRNGNDFGPRHTLKVDLSKDRSE